MSGENSYTDANGVRYVAKEATRLCDGCSFLWGSRSCVVAAVCEATRRADKRQIIWIKDEA